MNNHPYQLHMYVTEPGFTINWSSPSLLATSLFRSAAVSQFNGRKIVLGHANARLETPQRTEYFGMHYASKAANLHNILIKGSGLGTLFHTQQGRFNDKKDIDHAHRDYEKNGKSHLLSFLLNSHQADAIHAHTQQFKQSDARDRYGFIVNPFGELPGHEACTYRQRLYSHPQLQSGSGCTAMMISALVSVGISSQELFDIRGKLIHVPTQYIGRNNTIGYERRVGLRRIFQDNPQRQEQGDSKELLWYSPQRMADRTQSQQQGRLFLGKYEIIEKHINTAGATQLLIDLRN